MPPKPVEIAPGSRSFPDLILRPKPVGVLHSRYLGGQGAADHARLDYGFVRPSVGSESMERIRRGVEQIAELLRETTAEPDVARDEQRGTDLRKMERLPVVPAFEPPSLVLPKDPWGRRALRAP